VDFIELFNGVVKLAKPASAEKSFAVNIEDRIKDLDIDSLDNIMLLMYFGEMYDIPEEIIRELQVETVQELKDFLEKNGNKFPTDVNVALKEVS
jgi:acyl carrier protein